MEFVSDNLIVLGLIFLVLFVLVIIVYFWGNNSSRSNSIKEVNSHLNNAKRTSFSWANLRIDEVADKDENITTSLKKEISRIQYPHPLLAEALKLLDIIDESRKSPLLVTVLGEFSAGKSTFINALLKEKLLAMKVIPTTATITKLQFGKNKQMSVYKTNGSKEQYELKELDKFTVETHIDDDELLNKIFYVQLELDNKFLTEIDLADTPGFNSSIERHTEITKNFIRHSDVIIWIFNAGQMFKNTEVKTLEKYCKYFKPIAIINKIDVLGKKSKNEALKELEPEIQKYVTSVEKFFPVNSKLALDSLNNSGFQESGMQDVMDYFKSDIIPNAKTTKNKMAIIKLSQIAENLQTVRLELNTNIVSIVEKINKFETEIANWEDKLNKYNECIANWNKDSKDKNVTYGWMVKNIERYLQVTKPSQSLLDKKTDLLFSFRDLEQENKKIEEMSKKISMKENKLNDLFSVYLNKFQIYEEKGFGLKKYLDTWGDWTEEKTAINELALKYERRSDKYNLAVDNFNSNLELVNKRWKELNKKMANFLNKGVLNSMNTQSDIIENLEQKLLDEEKGIKNLEAKHKDYIKQISIFNNNIVSKFKVLYKYLNKDANIENDTFDSFESMIKEFSSYSEAHTEINWKELYSRNQIKGVIDEGKEKELKNYIQSEQINKDERVAEKV